MRSPVRVTKARFRPAPPALVATGLEGWIELVLDDAVGIEGVHLRRTREGRLLLVWPSRYDADGRRHYIAWPLDDVARRSIEAQLIKLLRLDDREAS